MNNIFQETWLYRKLASRFWLTCLVWVTIFIGCGWSGCAISNAKTESTINVSMTLYKLNTNECVIRVAITNMSDKRLTFNSSELPWNVLSQDLTIALVEEDSFLKKAVPRSLIIADRGFGAPYTIAPKQGESREMQLDGYYGEIIPALLRHDVTLLWVYNPVAEGISNPVPIVGQMRIPHIVQAGD